MMSSTIRTENLTKKFRRVDALNGLNLDVSDGAIYALVGPNGAGKTTAIKILMNIFGPTNGRATVLGMDSTRLAGRAFTAIAYVSENQELPGWMRVDGFMAYLRPFLSFMGSRSGKRARIAVCIAIGSEAQASVARHADEGCVCEFARISPQTDCPR